MNVSNESIKELRNRTGVSVMQCKKALEEAAGDMEKALVILRRKGTDAAGKKAERMLAAGAIGAYVHTTNEIAAMVQLSSETDFVSKNAAFIALAREIAMHIAATNPRYLSRSDIDEAELQKAREVFEAEAKDKPADIREKIVNGKLDAYFKEQILLEQPYIKDPERTVADLVTDAVQKFGERIEIGTFVRFSIK